MRWEQQNSIVCSKSKAYRISKRSSSRGGLFGRSLRRGEGRELVRVAEGVGGGGMIGEKEKAKDGHLSNQPVQGWV